MNNAIILSSFGTTKKSARENSLEQMTHDFTSAFPEDLVIPAYTSGVVRSVLRKKGISIFSPQEALEEAKRNEIDHVFLQPTHIIEGFEYEKLLKACRTYQNSFKSIKVGKPLLENENDYKELARIIFNLYQPEKVDADFTLLMGHGSAHTSGTAYEHLNHILSENGVNSLRIACVEGEPDFKKALDWIQAARSQVVLLAPFMLVAGEHAKNDMTGGENSWENALKEAGYQTRSIIKGLGEYPQVRRLYVNKAQQNKQF